MKKSLLSIIFICLIALLLLPLPVSAQTNSFLFRDIGFPISLGDLGISDSDVNIEQQQLRKEYTRIRNISRALGTDFNVNIPIRTIDADSYSITAFRQAEQTWHNLTAGYSLNLVAQEIERQVSSFSPPAIDVLLKDKKTGIYHPLNNISTTQYCNLLISR